MSVKFGRRFKKEYKKSPDKVRKQFHRRLDLFLKDRYNVSLNNHCLTGKWKGFSSINITGDWRAIFIQNDNNLTIFVAIGTHSQLYG